jgi:hypothetical protein
MKNKVIFSTFRTNRLFVANFYSVPASQVTGPSNAFMTCLPKTMVFLAPSTATSHMGNFFHAIFSYTVFNISVQVFRTTSKQIKK